LLKNIYLEFVIKNNFYTFAHRMENIEYINSVMSEINDLTDTIYEHLVDAEYKEMKSNIQILIKVLRDLDKSHENIPE